MVPVLKIRFQTEDLSQVEILNGYEFEATTSLEQGAFRWWISGQKTWRDWQVGEVASPVIIVKKNGVWSIQATQGRILFDLKAISTCSEVPRMEKK